jgi:hypothetical protein
VIHIYRLPWAEGFHFRPRASLRRTEFPMRSMLRRLLPGDSRGTGAESSRPGVSGRFHPPNARPNQPAQRAPSKITLAETVTESSSRESCCLGGSGARRAEQPVTADIGSHRRTTLLPSHWHRVGREQRTQHDVILQRSRHRVGREENAQRDAVERAFRTATSVPPSPTATRMGIRDEPITAAASSASMRTSHVNVNRRRAAAWKRGLRPV